MQARNSETDPWVVLGAGLLAYADGKLEVGEWDEIARHLEQVDEDTMAQWLEVLSDPEKVEAAFAELAPPTDPRDAETILYRVWQVALADGAASEVETSVHQRLAQRLGIPPEQVEAWQRDWSERAAARAEVAVGLAARLAHVDGRLDPAEAASFTELLEAAPVPVARRLELGAYLHAPPDRDALVERARALPEVERRALVRFVAPMVRASARGEEERAELARFCADVGLGAEALAELLP